MRRGCSVIPPDSAERGVDHGLDGVHPVLRLVEHHRPGGLEHLVGDLHLRQAELLRDLRPDGGPGVVEGGQAVHKDGGLLGVCHHSGVDLIGPQQPDALLPDRIRLAHGDPDVGVDHVGLPGALPHVLRQGHGPAALRREALGGLHQILGGEKLLGRAGGKVEPHFRAGDHQGVAHIVPGVPHVGEAEPLQRPELLLDGQQIRQHLGGVELIGQPVPHRHPGVPRQLLHQLLVEPPVLDAVVHPPQHPRGVGDGLLECDVYNKRFLSRKNTRTSNAKSLCLLFE